MLDVRRLEVLAAAVRERSIASAARSLGITPSAASQALGALEAQAGTSLLERGPRGVVPTPAGERLAAQAEAVLVRLAEAEAELTQRENGVVRLAAFATAVGGLLPPALRDLRTSPGAPTLRVVEVEPDDARAALRAGSADLALVNHDARLAPDSHGPWRVVHLVDEPVLAVLPPEHRLAGQRTVDVAALATDDWVMQAPASPCQELVLRVCADEGFAPAVSATCADYRSIVRLVEAGHGVSLVPRLALDHLDLGSVRVAATRVPVRRRIAALVPAGRPEPGGMRALLAALRDAAVRAAARLPG